MSKTTLNKSIKIFREIYPILSHIMYCHLLRNHPQKYLFLNDRDIDSSFASSLKCVFIAKKAFLLPNQITVHKFYHNLLVSITEWYEIEAKLF